MNAVVDMTEREWAAQVAELARMLGWRRYHTYRSDRSAPGWPDEALVRDRLVLLELKTEKGKLSDAQRDWLGALDEAGVEVYVVRPRHLDQLAHVLSARPDPRRLDPHRAQARRARDELRAALDLELGRDPP